MPITNQDMERGLATARQVLGRDFQVPFPRPKEAEEAWMRLALGALFGEVWSRPPLDVRTRALLTFATMAAMGFHQELELYIHGLRHLGFSREEISEMIIHVGMYAGIPRAVDGLAIARRAFDQEDAQAS
ncbi:MAG: carboxymuconolactone decarboxylase family protein [Dehalococcoidia bacterium]